MSLSFLVPAFLAGLAALVIPLVVHLTRKRRARVHDFPSLMFLEKVSFQEESRRRIQHWFLLLLRALAVILLVAAFARPFFTDAETAVGATGGPREVVVLVDNSYSMAVGDHWEEARSAAREVIGDLGPLDRASVVFFARRAHVAVRSTGDPVRLRTALDTASLGDEATAYGPGLRLAQTILEESELPSGEVVLIGDLQRAGWTGDEGVGFPPGTRVRTVGLAEETPANRAVSGVELRRERFQGQERMSPEARLVRTGGDGPVEVEVVLEIDDRELQRRTVTLPANGAAPVAFQPFTLTERHTRGTVRFAEADPLPGDDAHHFVVSPGRALPVLVLDDAPSAGGAGSLYLRRALEIGGGSAFEVERRQGGGVGPAELEGQGVVVVNDRPISASQAGALRDFVEAGGGLLVILGERASWPDGDALLPARPGPPGDRDGEGGRLGYLEYDHPVFEIFRGPRSGDFTGARFFRTRSLTLPDGGGDARVLARYDDGSPALVEGTVGDGRVLVWSSTLDAFWNDLVLQPVFLPWTHQLVRHASGRAEELPSFTAGQVVDVTDGRAMATAGLGETAEVLAAGEERVVLTPSGGSMPLPSGAQPGGAEPHFLALQEQGFYRIRPPGSGGDLRPVAVAVNVDPAEADLTPLDPEEVVASLTPSGEGGGRTTEVRTAELQRADRERRQSLWRFLLAGAFVLLLAETVLANRVSPRSPRGARTAASGAGG